MYSILYIQTAAKQMNIIQTATHKYIIQTAAYKYMFKLRQQMNIFKLWQRSIHIQTVATNKYIQSAAMRHIYSNCGSYALSSKIHTVPFSNICIITKERQTVFEIILFGITLSLTVQ